MDCLTHGSLFYEGRPYAKTVALVLPDGGVKRVPTIRVQVAVWTRFYGEEIGREGDRWMTEKIDRTIASWRRFKVMTDA